MISLKRVFMVKVVVGSGSNFYCRGERRATTSREEIK
jgi:hypothetical protein